MSCHLYVSRL